MPIVVPMSVYVLGECNSGKMFISNMLAAAVNPPNEMGINFEFKTLLLLSSAISKKPIFFCTRPSNRRTCGIGRSKSQGPRLLLSAKFSSATTQATQFLQVLSRSSFKRLVL